MKTEESTLEAEVSESRKKVCIMAGRYLLASDLELLFATERLVWGDCGLEQEEKSG